MENVRIASQLVRNRFKQAPRAALWNGVSDQEWNQWIWQHQKRVKSLEVLEKLIHLTDSERQAFTASTDLFRVAITPYYASLMDPEDPNCAIRLQTVPTLRELTVQDFELEDPLGEEKYMPVPGLTHRYPDRALLYTTHHCPVYCRHCTRKRKVSDPTSSVGLAQLERAFQYIEAHPEIRDVLVSGGDPLSLSDERLEMIISRLRAIEHVIVIRLATRNLVTLPQRITQDLANMLKKYQPIYVQTHFNHPKECTLEAFDAAALLADAGCVLGNQTVLLKGINDRSEVIKELNYQLLAMRIKPYYLHQCDMAQGISHFRTPIATGIQIIKELRGWMSGLAIPHYAVDLPGGGGKVSLVPEYLTDATEGEDVVGVREMEWSSPESGSNAKLIFRNYRNDRYEYFDLQS